VALGLLRRNRKGSIIRNKTLDHPECPDKGSIAAWGIFTAALTMTAAHFR